MIMSETTAISLIKPGDIVACRNYKFYNDAAASYHPFLVLSVSPCVTVLICTDAQHSSKFVNNVNIDWKSAGLRKPTIVITDKIGVIKLSDITRKIGTLKWSDYLDIQNVIKCNKSLIHYFEIKEE